MVRIQLDMPDEQVEVLDELMRDLNIRTRKDLFNNALTLLEWAAKEKRAGRMIASINEKEGKFRELLMPVLEARPVSNSRGAAAQTNSPNYDDAGPAPFAGTARKGR